MLSFNTQFETSNVRNKKKLDNFHLPPIIMPQNQNQIKNQFFFKYQDKQEKDILNSSSFKNEESLKQKKQHLYDLNSTTVLPNINESKNNLIYPFPQQSFNSNNTNNNNIATNFNISGNQELYSGKIDKKLNTGYDYYISNTDIYKNEKNKNNNNNISDNLKTYILSDKQNKQYLNSSPSLVKRNTSLENINNNLNIKKNTPNNCNKNSYFNKIEDTTHKIENKEMLSKVDIENIRKSYNLNNNQNINENINENINFNKNNYIQNELNSNILNNINNNNVNENYENYNNLKRTRRKSWWDSTKNRDDEIQKVKELLRNNTELINPTNNNSDNNNNNSYNKNNINPDTFDNKIKSSNNISENTNNDLNSKKTENNDTKIINAKLQRMKLIQKRNSSNHIKELLTYHDDITTSTTTTTTNKENRVDSTHELSSSKIENQNSTTSNNDKIKYINDKNSSNKDYKKLNKDQSNVNDNTNKFINNTNNTYDVINNIKENKIKNINEIYNNGNRLTENTVDKNSNNMKNLVKMENINSSELDLLNKEINKHTKNNIFKTENNKTLIQEYNREKDSQTKSINVENENNNSRSSIDPFIKNDVNNMSKHEYDSNRKSLISKNIYYCKDKYNIDNKDEISNNESKVDQKEVLKNNSISSNTIYDYSLNSLPINEKNVPNQNILNTKKYTLNENEYYDHLNDDNSKVLEKEVDKMVKQKSSNKENFELKNEQSKRNIHESTKNINKNDNNVKPDLIKEVSNIKSSVDLGLEYKGNEDNFPEKNKYLQCIKDLKKKITEYKEIEKNYNQMILNMKKYQNHNKEDERLHISPSAVKLIMNYLHHYGYDRSVEFIRNETGIGANTKNYKILKQLINKREFEKAVNFTKEVYESKSNSENRFKSSYEDLLYILNKYLLLNYLQERKQDEATALFNNYICGHIKNEIDKGGSRAEWFNKDYKLLSTLININKSTEIEKINTFFNSWDWDKEIKQFWKNGFNAYKSSYNLTKGKLSQAPEEQTNIPLFAYVLAAYFLEEEDLMDDYDYQTSYKILDNINNFSKEIKNILNKDYSKFDDENKITEKSTVGSCIPTSTKNEPRITVSNNSEDNNSNLTHCESSNNIYTIATGKRRIKSAGIFRSTGNLSSNYSLLNERKIHSSHSTQSLNKKKSQSMINGIYDPIESQNEKQGIINSNQFKGFVLTNDMMKPDFGTSRLLRTPDSTNSYQNPYIDNEMLPSVSNENETSYFTFFSCLGPMMGTIRALDIKSIPSTKQVIGVSACGDDRGDRKISLWDLNSSSLITQLDNKTSKTVLTLTFHPVWEEVLLSSDMEFDVKLWNWKTGKLLKVWKKHHTRIIHKAGFIPGNFEKAISCSSDQSIKIWNVTNDDSKVSSIHSNEPFTSFTFWGDGHNQVLVASLNYSIKLYKLRTSSHLHTIALNDLKSNRTPITSITSHPIQDNFILISSDNKLLLFDLRTSTTLKTFCAREIIPGLRIQGDFSPCGNYIYSGCADVKSFDSRKNSLLSSNSMSISYSNLNNGEDQIESSINKINTTGIFIWKLHTGKLERNDMSIMEESTIYSNVELYPVTLCKWISLNNDNKEENRNKKVLISASIDRCLKIYSG